MNLVLADILLHKTTKLQESSTGWHWSPLAPESPVREAGWGLGTCPGAAAAALGITIPRTAGTGADTTESGKREKPHGHRDPKVGSPVNAAQSPRYPRVSLETLTGERGGVSPRSRAQSAEVQGGSSRGDPGLSRRLGASRTQGPIRQEMPTNICCFQREIPHVAPLGARLTDCLLLCGFKCPLVLRALPAAAPPGPSAPQSPGFLTSLDSAPTFGIFHAYTVSGPGCL